MKNPKPPITLTAAVAGEEDRISALPDDIIHHILSHVDNSKQAARSSALSKRWAALWRSYPILEYYGGFSQSPPRSLKNFVAAASKKLSDDTFTIEAIRIRFDQNAPTNLVNALFASAKKSPREIDVGSFYTRRPLDKNTRLLKLATVSSLISRRLRILKLDGFEIGGGLEATEVLFGCLESLCVLHLSCIRVIDCDADDERGAERDIVNRAIAAACGLEELSLFRVCGVRHLRVHDHPNLRRLELHHCSAMESVELTGLVSLATLTISDYSNELKILSPMPKLKTLKVRAVSEFTCRVLHEYYPSLDSLELSGVPSDGELKIRSLSLRWLKLCQDYGRRVPRLKVVELDVPRLNHVIYDVLDLDLLSGIDWVANCVSADAVFVLELRLSLKVITLDNFRTLKMLFTQLSRQFQLVLHIPYLNTDKVLFNWSRLEEESPTPVIDHVEFAISDHNVNKFLNGLFWSCRPKYLVDRYRPLEKCLLSLKQVCIISSTKRCHRTCECWRWRNKLEDVKIVKNGRFDHRQKGILEVDEVDVSELKYTNTSNGIQNRICYELIWHD